MDAQSSEVHPLFPKPLSIAKVIAPIKYKRAIVRAVEGMGQVEPIEVDPRTGSDEMEVETRRNEMEAFQSKLTTYLGALDSSLIRTGDPVSIGPTEDDVRTYIQDVMEQKGARIDEIITRKDEIDDRISELQSIMELIEKFDYLNIEDRSMLRDTRHVETYMGTVFPAQMQRLTWEIDEITDSRYLMIEHEINKENTILALSVLKQDSDAVQTKLKTFSFSDVVIPDDVDFDGLTQQDCLDEIASLEKENLTLDSELDQLASDVGDDLIAAKEIVDIELTRISVEKKMRRTKTTCVMWAWVPEELQDELKTEVHSATEGSATFDFRKGEYDPDFTPSRVENSEFMQPMRGLVTSFGTPGLHEVDPYRFVAILFPVLFGIMFADLGHGLVLMLFGFWAKRKRDKMTETPKGISAYIYGGANLMIIMGATSAVMGIAFNSFFGDETILWQVPLFKAIFAETTWDFFFLTGDELSPEAVADHIEIERDYVALLIFSFAVGAVVILTGLVLNLYQLYYYRHSDAEWYAGLTLFGTYFLVVVTVILFVALQGLPNVALWVLIVGISLAILSAVATLGIEAKAHGIDGLMLGVDHLLALMSNTFSFGRLLAMNTIHFVLALLPYLFMDLGGLHVLNHSLEHWIDWQHEPMLLFWWGLAALIGTLIVVPVETTFSTLQALRLNWVEFFGKFFKGNGVEFKPIKVNRIHTQEQ